MTPPVGTIMAHRVTHGDTCLTNSSLTLDADHRSLVGATGAGSGDLPARRPRRFGVSACRPPRMRPSLVALGGLGAELLGLVGEVRVEQ